MTYFKRGHLYKNSCGLHEKKMLDELSEWQTSSYLPKRERPGGHRSAEDPKHT